MNSPIEISSDSEIETITSGSGDEHSILYVADFEISDTVLSCSIIANKPAFLPRKQLAFLSDQQEFIYLGRKRLPELIICSRNRNEASIFLTAHDGTWNFPVKCPQCGLWLQDVNLVILHLTDPFCCNKCQIVVAQILNEARDFSNVPTIN